MSKRVRWVVLAAGLVILGTVLFRGAASFLVVNKPEHADVIVVLAGGEDSDLRYWNGVRLMRESWAPRLILDVFAKGVTFGVKDPDLARDFVNRTTPGQSTICPIILNSTYDEAQYVADCLRGSGAKSILVVTSAYHTRRALEIFQKRLPQYHVSIYAAPDDYFFGTRWWQKRDWAKTTLLEWQRYLWWSLVDRWRGGMATT